MNELGQMLREARETKGISLAEAEAQTRIRQKFIAALEAEDWDVLPNEVTTRGFLRKYANYLALDETTVVRQFEARAKVVTPQPEMAAPIDREVDYRPIEMDLSPAARRTIPWGWLGAAAVILLVAAGALYLYFFQPNVIANLLALPQRLMNPVTVIAPEPTAAPTDTVLVTRVTATPTPTAESTATPTAAQASTATPAPATPAGAASPTAATPPFQPVELMVLGLEIDARAWVRLLIDNGLAMEAVLEPGEQREWEARESIVLRTGNAAGVRVRLNGQELPALGGGGEVVEVQWRLVDGQVVRLTPTAAPTPTPGATPEETPTLEASPEG